MKGGEGVLFLSLCQICSTLTEDSLFRCTHRFVRLFWCRNFSLDNRVEKKGHGYIRKEVRLGCCIFSSSGSYSSKGHLKVRRHFLQCVHADFSLPGYSTLEYKTRSNNVPGGGVGIYVGCNIPYSVAPMYSVFSDRLFESIFVELNLPSTKLIVGSVYRPNINHPNLTQTEQLTQSLDLLSNLLSQLSSTNANVRILGDFNIDVLKYNTSGVASEYVDLLFSFGF